MSELRHKLEQYLKDEDGNFYRVDQEDGTITRDARIYELKPGDSVRSAAQREAYVKHVQKEAQKTFAIKRNDGSERFTFINVTERFPNVSPASVTRLIYLSTFCDYDGRLLLNNRTSITFSKLPDILNISKRSVYLFWDEVKDKYIIEEDSCLKIVDKRIFRRGKLDKNTEAVWAKLFNKSVQMLYENCKPSKHKILGYVFIMLQYVNVEHNILCWNPLEKDIERIQTMSFSQFCELIGYNPNNAARLFKDIFSLKFAIGGIERPFCFQYGRKLDGMKNTIFINPKVIYRGKKTPDDSLFRVGTSSDNVIQIEDFRQAQLRTENTEDDD